MKVWFLGVWVLGHMLELRELNAEALQHPQTHPKKIKNAPEAYQEPYYNYYLTVTEGRQYPIYIVPTAGYWHPEGYFDPSREWR